MNPGKVQTNYQVDPVVEILRLAYRRGLTLRKEQEKSQASNQEPMAGLLPIDKLVNKVITESSVETTDQINLGSA